MCDILSDIESGRRTFFDAHPVFVDDQNEVFVVLGLERDAFDRVPHIQTTWRDVTPVHSSFVKAVVRNLLGWTSRALQARDYDLDALRVGPGEIARGAADIFIASLFYCADQIFGSGVVDKLNVITALTYEGRSGVGHIIVGRKETPGVKVALALNEPVALSDLRASRKLVEAGGPTMSLLSDGEKVYAFGWLDLSEYDASSETVFRIAIEGRGLWTIFHGQSALLTVQDGAPRLPKPPLDEEYLRDVIERLLTRDTDLLVELARSVGRPEHGAMLVISSSAADEAGRLSSQAWQVLPAKLSAELVAQLVAIDGAILVDPSGFCHGIGVIMDGAACEYEDPARGSRYNNAVRYVSGPANPPAVIIVYSSDGSIDVLPRLHPRVKREDIVEAVANYEREIEAYTSRPPHERVDGPRAGVAVARKRLEGFRFYLTEEQCERANSARDFALDWERKHSTLQVIEADLHPDKRMNDSYLLD